MPKYEKVEFTTFRPMKYYMQRDLECTAPSCFNGDVRFRKYKITCELMEEPLAILAARLQMLWDHCDNYKHEGPLKEAAQEIGYTLQGERGSAC